MAGSVVVLHRKDSDIEKERLETTNLGLQSITNKSDGEVAELVYRASSQKQIAQSLIEDCARLNAIISTYTMVANALYSLIQQLSFETNNVQKMVDVESEAVEVM